MIRTFSLDHTHRREGGFTLIELMIVVLIIAVLIAIAIPTFLGARRRSQDSQAKSHVRAALVSEKIYFSDHAAIYTDSVSDMRKIEPNLAWGSPDAGARGVVIENVSLAGQGVVLKSRSRSGTLFCLADTAQTFDYTSEGYPITSAGTWYARSESSMCTSLVWESSSSGWT